MDAAISYSPEKTEEFDKEIKLYLFICEVEKPDFKHCNNDYDKLIRSMHDCYNSLIIYFSKKARLVSLAYFKR